MEPLMMIASALAISAYSFFSRYIDVEEKSKVASKLRQYLLVTVIYAVLILGAITFILPFILKVVMSKYQIEPALAFFFGMATAIRIISAAQGGILLSLGKFNYTFKIALINICSLFPLYFMLIPRLNLKGVLVSIIISEMICVGIKAKTLMKVLF
jgi:O-antigen/teichoic acid export membrane protein